MALELPQAITDLVPVIAAAITGTILGRERSASDRLLAIAEAAVCEVYQYAPAAPLAILRESSIRYAGWIAGSRPHVTASSTKDPSGIGLPLNFNALPPRTASGPAGQAQCYRATRCAAPGRYPDALALDQTRDPSSNRRLYRNHIQSDWGASRRNDATSFCHSPPQRPPQGRCHGPLRRRGWRGRLM